MEAPKGRRKEGRVARQESSSKSRNQEGNREKLTISLPPEVVLQLDIHATGTRSTRSKVLEGLVVAHCKQFWLSRRSGSPSAEEAEGGRGGEGTAA